jgi:levansucrase
VAGLTASNRLTATGLTWDAWFTEGDTAPKGHIFYLQADPGLPSQERHAHSSIGHAVYTGGGQWTTDECPVIPQGTPGSFDEAVWTGSVLSLAPKNHIMLYTGRSMPSPNHQYVQRIGLARSNDPAMRRWRKHGVPVLLSGGPYSTLDRDDSQIGPIWRDPHLFVGEDGQVYAAIAARHADPTNAYSACIGLVRAIDSSFTRWEYLPPIVTGNFRYGEMEVPQVVRHGGLYYIFFTVHSGHYSPAWAAEIGGARSGLHCYVTDRLGTPPVPVNDTGSVLDDTFVRGLRLIGPPSGNKFDAIGWLDGENTPQGFVGGLSSTYTIMLDGTKVHAEPRK